MICLPKPQQLRSPDPDASPIRMMMVTKLLEAVPPAANTIISAIFPPERAPSCFCHLESLPRSGWSRALIFPFWAHARLCNFPGIKSNYETSPPLCHPKGGEFVCLGNRYTLSLDFTLPPRLKTVCAHVVLGGRGEKWWVCLLGCRESNFLSICRIHAKSPLVLFKAKLSLTFKRKTWNVKIIFLWIK